MIETACQRKNIRLFELLVCPLCGAATLGRRGAAPVCLSLCALRRRCIVQGGSVEFLSEYASFLAKTLTLVVAIVVVLVAIAATRGKGRRGSGQLQVQKLNDFYKDLRERLEHSVLSKDQLKATRKAQAKAAKQEKKAPSSKPRVFVLDFDGDIKASATISWMTTSDTAMTPGNNQLRGQTAFWMLHPGLAAKLDYPHLSGIAAPKPALFISGAKDRLMPAAGTEQAFATMRQIWQAHGAGEKLVTELWPEYGHQFSAAQQQRVWRWLEEVFAKPAAADNH